MQFRIVRRLITMNGKLLDTNIIIRIINGDEKVAVLLDSIAVDEVYIPTIVYGELMYGAERLKRTDKNKYLFEEFCLNYKLVCNDKLIAETYGKVKNNLKNKGINIPKNDIWIAATAINRNFELISGDKHFANIENLNLIDI